MIKKTLIKIKDKYRTEEKSIAITSLSTIANSLNNKINT